VKPTKEFEQALRATLLAEYEDPMDCTCHPVGLNSSEIVAYDWRPECPAHGTESEWYRTEGKAHLDASSDLAVRMQALARKARSAGRPVCRYCGEFLDECKCPNTVHFDDQAAVVYAPWTSDQVAALRLRQADTTKHPYTCPNHHGALLLPTPGGWVCMPPAWVSRDICPYTQNWAYREDAE
jgi:hypothetical protein